MRIVFMGTPEVAVPSLDALRGEHDIALVVTQTDKPAGRGHKLLASPVKRRALELGLPLAQPERARNEEFVAQLRELRPEAIAVVAYGQILPRAMLDLPHEFHPHGGCINLHFSLLPRWRGAAPVQHAILAGDRETGVTTQWMAEKLDAGEVILQRRSPIGPQETSGDLLARLAQEGAGVLSETLRLVAKDEAPRVPQDEAGITLAPSIKKEQARLDWSQSGEKIVNAVRAYNPAPGAWCEFRGEPFRVWQMRWNMVERSLERAHEPIQPGVIFNLAHGVMVTTVDGAIELVEVQPSGKPRMKASDWARGAHLALDEQLG